MTDTTTLLPFLVGPYGVVALLAVVAVQLWRRLLTLEKDRAALEAAWRADKTRWLEEVRSTVDSLERSNTELSALVGTLTEVLGMKQHLSPASSRRRSYPDEPGELG